jgi:hypothetical protein
VRIPWSSITQLLLTSSLEIVKVCLDLVEEPPGARALRRQQPAPMLEAALRPARHRAQDMEIGQQRLGR